MLERSTESAAWAALVRVNLTVSNQALVESASPITSPRTLRVDDVSSNPPSTVSLLFSELSNPVLRTAKANTEATTTKAISTMAASRPVIHLWSLMRVLANILCPPCEHQSGVFFASARPPNLRLPNIMPLQNRGRLIFGPGFHHGASTMSDCC